MTLEPLIFRASCRLTLNGGVEIQAGVVFSRNLNAAGSKTQFSNGAGFTGVAFEMQNGGVIEFNSGNQVFQGTSTFTGAGTAQLLVGTLTAPPSGTGTLSIGAGAVFLQSSGALGQDGSLFIEQGAFQKTGGTTGGSVTSRNGASFIMNGGTIGGSFANRAAFDWQNGSIGGQFVNHAEGVTAADTFKITTTNVHTVSAGTTLTNHGLIRHQSTGQMSLGAGTTLLNETQGIYEFTAGGTVSHGGGGSTTSTFNNKGTLRVAAAGATATVSTGLTNATGRIAAAAGTLRITGQAAISGGVLDADTGAVLEITKGALSGSINHPMAGGLVTYNNTAGAGQLTINASLGSSGTGEVRFAGSADVPAGSLATMAFGPTAPGRLTGVLRVDGALKNTRAFVIAGGTIRAQNGGVFTNDTTGSNGVENSLFISGSGFATLDGTGAGPQFINKGRINHAGTGALLLDRQAVLLNQDDYTIDGDGDIQPGGAATQIAFVNQSTLSKLSGSGISDVTVPFDNQGTAGNVFALAGTLRFTNALQFNGSRLSGGVWTVDTGGTLHLVSGTITENDARIMVRGSGVFVNLPTASSTTSFQNDGILTLDAGADVNLGSGPFVNNGGVRINAGCTLRTGPFTSNPQSTLQSSGTLQSNVTQNGTLAPGNTPGELTINGTLAMGATSTLEIELDGTNPGVTYDKVTVTGAVTLDGELEVTVLSNAVGLPAGSTFTFLTASSVNGTFATLDLPKDASGNPLFSVQYNPASVVLTALGPVQPAQIQSWRQQHFGTTANSGDAADLNDFDDDGLENLLEYALDDDPTISSRDALPEPDTSTGRLALSFTRFVAKTDITITVQASESLTGAWTDLARSTGGGATTALLGGVTVTETGSGETRAVTVEDAFDIDDPAHPKRFLRLQVTRP